ncbi:MAG: glutamate 5-kinase [Clostridia bacterium]|nr:glutamate 5-kinase [Clostridia bacterium]
MNDVLQDISAAQRIVVKVGTSTLTYETGKMNLKRIDQLARILSDLRNRGKEIILVSSGAIGIAMGKLGLSQKPQETRQKQAVAAVGQCELMYLYDKLFSEYNNTVAQILLTKDDIAIPRRKRNTQNTFATLLEMGIIPVVNENDTVSTDEIEIGDNDTLSAVVADLVDADLLVLFSDIDGLYDSDPRTNPDATLLRIVYDIDKVKHSAGGAGSSRGTGGMITKLAAAEIATSAGIHMVIANGANLNALYELLEGNPIGTLFVSKNFRGENDE